ncbi:Mutant VeA1 protein [Ophidiomyces ophidiicola]|nr:Mutant VeA1 protein [Ophidiomyces ophidiicola]
MASKASILNPPNETENSFTRTTKEGKKLTYTLKVIQQPERARACGAGAKASADRRPVDPPPVVELRVHESDQNGLNKTDITFAYNANFFLFTTLEWARPIAHGRVQGQSSATPPVLTGVPVAGVAYLDRPVQAGYFIFPDLSVRHEGYYRLNFSLYEEVKDPKDEDKDRGIRRPAFPATKPCDPREPEEYIFFRLDVKTTPFTVYSAKKFPGLAESTMLSRTVAEQGCRVRIRRDVRMRRREAKGNKDFRGG